MVRRRHPGGAYRRDTHTTSPINFGAASDKLYGSQVDLEPATVLDIGQGSVTDGAIAPGGLNGATAITPNSLTITPFADTVRPVSIVDALPTLPDADYPVNSYVVLSSNTRLYKNIAGSWGLGVHGSDIVADTITAGQIAAGAISASEIAAGAVSTDKLSVGARWSPSLVANHSFEDNTGNAGQASNWSLSVNGVGSTGYAEKYTSGASALAAVIDGEFAFTLYSPAGVGFHARAASSFFGVVAGEKLFGQVSVYPTHTATGGTYFRLAFYKSDSTFISNVDIESNGSSVATVRRTISGYATAPALATFARVELWNYQPSVGGYLLYDQVMVQRQAGGVRNSDGNVLIDANGITITNGKLNIQDEFGKSSMNASGFSGSWGDFVATGLYNGGFEDNAVASPASSGRTVHAPYWTYALLGGAPVFTTAVGSLSWTLPASGASASLTSDRVRISEGEELQVTVVERNTGSSNNQTNRVIKLEFYADAIGGSPATLTVASDSLLQATLTQIGTSKPVRGGSGYKYVAVRIEASWGSVVTGTPNYALFDVSISNFPGIKAVSFASSSNYTVTSTVGDVPGLVYSAPLGRDYLVTWVCDVDVTTTGYGVVVSELYVEGVAHTSQLIFSFNLADARATVSQQAKVTISSGGSGEIKVRARKTINAGVVTIISPHSTMTVIPL